MRKGTLDAFPFIRWAGGADLDVRTVPEPLQKARIHANRKAPRLEKWVLPPPLEVTSSHTATIRHCFAAPKSSDLWGESLWRLRSYHLVRMGPDSTARPMQKHMLGN